MLKAIQKTTLACFRISGHIIIKIIPTPGTNIIPTPGTKIGRGRWGSREIISQAKGLAPNSGAAPPH
jgi:hypothetical protein